MVKRVKRRKHYSPVNKASKIVIVGKKYLQAENWQRCSVGCVDPPKKSLTLKTLSDFFCEGFCTETPLKFGQKEKKYKKSIFSVFQ